MRNERHYFANGQGIKEQKHNLHFAVSELMDLAFSQGYFVEGYGNAISCSVLFRYLRRQKIIPTHFMEQYKQDILRDIQNARAQMEDEKSRCYNMGCHSNFFLLLSDGNSSIVFFRLYLLRICQRILKDHI